MAQKHLSTWPVIRLVRSDSRDKSLQLGFDFHCLFVRLPQAIKELLRNAQAEAVRKQAAAEEAARVKKEAEEVARIKKDADEAARKKREAEEAARRAVVRGRS